MEGYWRFWGFLVSALLAGFVSVLCVLIWAFHWREGLGWNGGFEEFNWHPILMVTGFIFIQGIAIIVYRLPWTWKCSKPLMKFIHAGLNTVTFILVVISLVAVFDFHNTNKIPNMYSLHSWIGLTATILHVLQFVLGICVYLLPFAPVSMRDSLMPVHIYSGLFIFGMVMATALLGFTEKIFFALKESNYAYKDSPPESIFVNTLGVLVLVFGALILWMVTRPEWKRPCDQIYEIQQLNKENPGGAEGSITLTDHSNDKSDVELNSEAAARKRNLKFEEAGQRSTM
ncbi:plasma membrane ascorbate-dependent reductase CYBRD1 [Latimeria chalumnae]|uniref:plasma membrane ascorbate-dependent reductase CYBRD1 n=1 Tax=Latimeria chalumnae TaxID=7897 RepID=UPI0003C0FF71|nr:PREDICTED: cytochrome b reductase 1 [Latimeria chalumnae]|eukprot:XP_006003034.1 PREDICTED: cytochrome b reductase 1 [Latimeria chalumnae]